jgi:hypothetical protein
MGQLGIWDQQRVERILRKPQSNWTEEEIALIRALQEQTLKEQRENT